MKTKILIGIFSLFSLAALADGPVVQTTPYTRGVLKSVNANQAQTALGFTGNDTSSVTMQSVSNWAQGALSPQLQSVTNTFAGIRENDVLGFMAAQFVGALVAVLYMRWQAPRT